MQDAWLLVLPIDSSLPDEGQPTNATLSLPAPSTLITHEERVPASIHAPPLTSKGLSKAKRTRQRNGRGRAGQGGAGGSGAGGAKTILQRNGQSGTPEESDEGIDCTLD